MSWWKDYDYDDDDFYDEDFIDDYETPGDAIVLEGPVRAESKRGDIGQEWWGKQWVQAMEHLGLDGRLQRGKRYARNGSVKRLEISHGTIYAEVQGSYRRPYKTSIHLKPLTDEEWQQALDALSQQAIYAAKLLAGEMPGDIEALFQGIGLSLFPQSSREIDFDCSCPDWGNPCKHCAAVYYLIAEQLDVDPFILFHIRGRKRDTVLQALRQFNIASDAIEAADAENYAITLENFWGDDPVTLVRALPVRFDKPFSLKQLGTPPGHIENEFKKLHKDVSEQALRWLGLE